jgi:hypothetical protein
MVQVVETDEFFLFYSTPRCGYYLPKRALPPGGLEEIRDLVTRHGPARRRLLTSAPAAA